MFDRITSPILTKSFFLFGARGTGKSTYFENLFTKNSIWFDLLDVELEDRLSRNPNTLKDIVLACDPNIEWVVIDEIQKLPKLLDIVHQLIRTTSFKFALTGSSARKLKQGGANLLAGRAFVSYMFPLTAIELADKFNLNTALTFGTLPEIYGLNNNEERQEYLRSYALTYLKEEIWGEQIIRKIDPFRKFLEVAAQLNCEVINYSNVANAVGVDVKTVQSYYTILSDTLIGFFLEPFHRSVRKQQRGSPKFYLFDPGIKRALEQKLTQDLSPSTYAYGKAFEHFVILEIYRLNLYYKKDYKLSYLLTKDGAEIDLIIEKPDRSTWLIEIKSVKEIDVKATKTIAKFKPDFHNSEAMVISLDPEKKVIDGIKCMFYLDAIKLLFSIN